MQAMEISLSALDVEWRRLEVIASNLASAEGTGMPASQRLVSGPRASFASYLEPQTPSQPSLDLRGLNGVAVYGIEPTSRPLDGIQDGTTAAGANVAPSNSSIDHVEQMTLLLKTSRAYEANMVAMNTARQMYSKALELGRRS